MTKKKNIPVFDLNKGAKAGFFIKSHTQSIDHSDHDIVSAHRDDSYMLFILKAGYCHILIDFEETIFTGPAFCLIHPEQVHALLDYGNPDGWMLAFDPGLLSQETSSLTTLLTFSPNAESQADSLNRIYDLADLIWKTFQSDDHLPHQPLTLQYLLNALLTAIASLNQSEKSLPEHVDNRGDEITGAFRQLLKMMYIDWKRPAQYAQALNLSVNHLNDTVKYKTGFSVSYWIQYQTMLEAKRLLYHTQQTIKEVAYQLGFEDQHYFSRLFRKVTGQTPVSFRHSFRDLSTESHS